MVTVVLVHWNQAERCATTIESFATQGIETHIIVVDNGSEREARRALIEAIERSPHDVELVSLGANRGFGPAANVGLRRFLATPQDAAGEWVAVAPHDAIPQPGALVRLVALAESVPGVGLASADVGDGHVPHVDPYFGGMTRPAAQDAGFERADYVHGTLLIARRGCLADIGLFEESFFAYCEEADLGLRATERGWEVGLAHGARVVNPGMRSGSPVADYLMHRNTLYLVRRWFGRYHAFVRLVIGASQLVRGLVQPSSRAWMFSASGRFWGMVDFLRGRTGPPPAHLVRQGRDEVARTGGLGPGTANIDPETGEASAVPAIGGGVRLS
jgi:N-acetylglucosaminyl-diphospho-decaprenol L-rhamnosyltransferase